MQLGEWLLTAASIWGPCSKSIPPFKEVPAGKLTVIFTEQPLKMLEKKLEADKSPL